MPQNTVEKTRRLVDLYAERLAEKEIVCNVTKKYFEHDVENCHYGRQGILKAIDEKLCRIKERRYKNQRNTYHCIVLRFTPVKKGILEKKDCKEYSFLLRKKERSHIGYAPGMSVSNENKLLSKVERRLKKVIEKSEKRSAETVCRNNISDILRYIFSVKYTYMKRIAGKERSTVDIIISCIIAAIVLLIVFICRIVSDI